MEGVDPSMENRLLNSYWPGWAFDRLPFQQEFASESPVAGDWGQKRNQWGKGSILIRQWVSLLDWVQALSCKARHPMRLWDPIEVAAHRLKNTALLHLVVSGAFK